MLRCERGLLLLEAVLAASAIALGLVFVSRSLTGPLKALQAMEAQEASLAMAERVLLECEARKVAQRPLPPRPRQVSEAGAWEIETERFFLGIEKEDEDPLGARVAVAARGGGKDAPGPPGAPVRLVAVWPAQWIPPEWK